MLVCVCIYYPIEIRLITTTTAEDNTLATTVATVTAGLPWQPSESVTPVCEAMRESELE